MERRCVSLSLCWAILLVVASSCSNHAYAYAETSYCGSEDSYLVKVKSVDIDPNPVVSGKPATFTISATSENGITGGKLTIEVFFYGVRVHTESHDLCTKTTCPVEQGAFTLTNSQSLPGFTPPGAYRIRMKMIDADDNVLTCIYIKFNIVHDSMISEI
uniref:TSA: Wollemia nobilis Ref_Wollemi_Transcript_28510_871 transcribed RNA sequence n=1 Tax=Wollemia nobilis TaxID=56998 RepID=A0A0C9RG92_9CONI